MRRLIPFLAVTLATAGCGPVAWSRVTINRPLHTQDVAFITPGETKWDDVIARLGVPSDLVGRPDGVVANYYYYDGRDFDVNFGWPLNFIPPASYVPHSLDFGGTGVRVDTFQVAFDANGTVQYDGFSHSAAASRFKMWPFASHGS